MAHPIEPHNHEIDYIEPNPSSAELSILYLLPTFESTKSIDCNTPCQCQLGFLIKGDASSGDNYSQTMFQVTSTRVTSDGFRFNAPKMLCCKRRLNGRLVCYRLKPVKRKPSLRVTHTFRMYVSRRNSLNIYSPMIFPLIIILYKHTSISEAFRELLQRNALYLAEQTSR